LALSPSVAAAHWPISLPALKLSVAKVGVGGVDRVERRVERDHQNAGVARLLDRSARCPWCRTGDQDALGAIGDAGLDRRDLAFIVAVDLAGIGSSASMPSSGLGGGAFLHLDEEGVGVGLGDQAGADSLRRSRRRRAPSWPFRRPRKYS
jgi:hypothetical protein